MFSTRLQEKTRRDFLKLSAAGVFAPALSGWLPVMAKAAPTAGKSGKGRAKSCILLWMDGGPSHKDTFDLKPESKGAGEFKPIKTSASGIEISEHLPKIAQVMHTGVIVRGMSTPEGAHARAKYYGHTGYREGQGGVIYPSIGSIAAKELGTADGSMPNYVAIGGRSYGSGFLGPKHQPLLITDPNRGVERLERRRRQRAVREARGIAGEDGECIPPRVRGGRHYRPQDDLRAGRQADAIEGGQGVRPRAGIEQHPKQVRHRPVRRRRA